MNILSRISIVLIILLLISALCVCPVVADDVSLSRSDVPSLITSQVLHDLSVNDDDNFFVFTTPDGRQGLVHFVHDVVYELIVGEQCARIVEDTPAYIRVDAVDSRSGASYQIIYQKFDGTLSFVDVGSGISPSALPASSSLVDIADVHQLEESIPVTSSLSTHRLLYTGLALLVAYLSPAFAIPTIWTLLADEYGVHAFLPFVLGADVLLVAGAACVGVISIAEIQNTVKGKDGVYQFAVETDGKYYLYEYSSDMEKNAKFLREVSSLEGVVANTQTKIVLMGNDGIRFVRENIDKARVAVESWVGTVAEFLKKSVDELRAQKTVKYHYRDKFDEQPCPAEQKYAQNTDAATYYQLNDKYKSTTVLYTETEAANKISSKCGDKGIRIGSTKEGCIKICEKGSEYLENSGSVIHDTSETKVQGQPNHCHAKDKGGNPCKPHCFWDY